MDTPQNFTVTIPASQVEWLKLEARRRSATNGGRRFTRSQLITLLIDEAISRFPSGLAPIQREKEPEADLDEIDRKVDAQWADDRKEQLRKSEDEQRKYAAETERRLNEALGFD